MQTHKRKTIGRSQKKVGADPFHRTWIQNIWQKVIHYARSAGEKDRKPSGNELVKK